ncbi:MAG TPA: hypothetical protein VMR62_10260, partial [Bryobacteraceae bacterium]|nr:hypothetical protein [Bryobacteraceae bacterium]
MDNANPLTNLLRFFRAGVSHASAEASFGPGELQFAVRPWNTAPPSTAPSAKSIGPLAFHSALAFALLVALAPQQFPIDLGESFP